MQNGSDRAQLLDEAFHLFGRVVTRSDPSRLEAWVGMGLTITQIRVLFLMRNEPGLSAGALAEALSVTPSTLTRIMDRLVRNDLVRRETAADDRRQVRHYLTSRGTQNVEELERTGRARMNKIFARLEPDQLEHIVGAFRLLAAAQDAVDAARSPALEV